MLRHVAEFYESEPSALIENVARTACDALHGGDVALVVAPAERMNQIQSALEFQGLDTREAIKRGRLEFIDAHEALDRFMFAGRPDPDAFDRVVGEAVRGMLARREASKLYAYGEMVGVLWDDGNEAGAVELEALWNALLADLPVSLHCGYPAESFERAVWTGHMEAVLDAHDETIPENLVATS